jgi:AraC-like DNA-binding protein
MHLARRELRDGRLGLAEISARVGYDSEAAFSGAGLKSSWDPSAFIPRGSKWNNEHSGNTIP